MTTTLTLKVSEINNTPQLAFFVYSGVLKDITTTSEASDGSKGGLFCCPEHHGAWKEDNNPTGFAVDIYDKKPDYYGRIQLQACNSRLTSSKGVLVCVCRAIDARRPGSGFVL